MSVPRAERDERVERLTLLAGRLADALGVPDDEVMIDSTANQVCLTPDQTETVLDLFGARSALEAAVSAAKEAVARCEADGWPPSSMLSVRAQGVADAMAQALDIIDKASGR